MIAFGTIFSFIFIVLVIYSVYAGFKYTRMISSIFLSLIYTPSLEFPSTSRGEAITILDSSDHEIEALLLEKKGSRKLVIFCHESGAAKESWQKYAYFFPELGFHVLSLDLASKEENGGQNSLSQWPTGDDVMKVVTAIRWAKKAFSLDVQIVLFGVSNGADIALAASFEDATVRAVIADGLFSMKEIFRDYIRKWAPILVKPNFFGHNYPSWVVNTFTELGFWYSGRSSGKKFVDVEKLLKRRHAPVLLVHGEADDYIPKSHQAFLEKIHSKKNVFERLVIGKAKHNEAVLVAPGFYQAKVVEFLKKV